MDRKRLFKHLAALIVFIFLVNFVANKFHWYYSIWYFDIIMHFLGGLWVGLLGVYVLKVNVGNSVSEKLILKVLAFVLVLGIGWEIYEISVDQIVGRDYFDLFDTMSDILMDISGGLLATLYLAKIFNSRAHNILK